MWKWTLLSLIFAAAILPPGAVQAKPIELNERLEGRILLDVASCGEAWYVIPGLGRRSYLGRPADALAVMSRYGLGISESDFAAFRGQAPVRLAGRIILRVEDRGQAYYIEPDGRTLAELGRPADALAVMSRYGLGISHHDLNSIPVEATVIPPAPTIVSSVSLEIAGEIPAMEERIFAAVNDYRRSKGLSDLRADRSIADIARGHSENMAAGRVTVGHDGFDERADRLIDSLGARSAAENVAYNEGYDDPAGHAVEQWIASSGHEKNLTGDLTLTGIGAAKTADGKYYFTQLFIDRE